MSAVGTTLRSLRLAGMVMPQAIKDNAEFVGSDGSTPLDVDTAPNGVKFNSAMVVVLLGASDIAIAAMKVYTSDDDSTYAEYLDFDTDGTLPSATGDNQFYAFDLDLRKTKRYLRILLTAGNGTAGTYAVAFTILGDPTELPSTDAERGLAEAVSN